jgi:hypothetical protein
MNCGEASKRKDEQRSSSFPAVTVMPIKMAIGWTWRLFHLLVHVLMRGHAKAIQM